MIANQKLKDGDKALIVADRRPMQTIARDFGVSYSRVRHIKLKHARALAALDSE